MTDRLALTKELAKGATQGEWKSFELIEEADGFIVHVRGNVRSIVVSGSRKPDAAYLANLDPAFVTTLCEQAEAADRLEAALRELRSDLSRWDRMQFGRTQAERYSAEKTKAEVMERIDLALAELEPK